MTPQLEAKLREVANRMVTASFIDKLDDTSQLEITVQHIWDEEPGEVIMGCFGGKVHSEKGGDYKFQGSVLITDQGFADAALLLTGPKIEGSIVVSFDSGVTVEWSE